MTNGEKYKTAKERHEAFNEYLSNVGEEKEIIDPFDWLELKAEEEKPMNCPFCGKKCSSSLCRADNCGVVACNYCGYRSSHTATVKGAIMNHNRVCKAVAAYKENN